MGWTTSPEQVDNFEWNSWTTSPEYAVIDTQDGRAMAIGWVFLGKDKYQDCNKSYLREVWITLHDGPPTRTTQIHYHELL